MASMQGSRTARLIDDLEQAFKWMMGLGVEVGPDRFAAYLKIAQKWDQFADGSGNLGPQALQPIAATLAYEAAAFTAAHRAFAGSTAEDLGGLVDRLSDAARGPIRIDDARSAAPHPARDALFEILTAAILHQAESGVGTAPRTALTHGRHHVHVECQRLGAQSDIETGLTDACKRLVQVFDIRSGTRKRGLVALDASRFVNPVLDGAAEAPLPHFIEQNIERIQRCLSGMDRRIIGAMVYASTLAASDETREVVHFERWVVVRRSLINISEFDLLGRLRELLHDDVRSRA